MLTDQKVRLKCKELIKKVSIYKNCLAIQLEDKIFIHKETDSKNASKNLNYQVHAVINKKIECNLMVVTSNHLSLCK